MNTAALIDELAVLDAQIKTLEARKSAVRETLVKALPAGSHEGLAYSLTITVSSRETLDNKACRAKLEELGVDGRFFSKHTKVTPVTTVRTTERAAPASASLQLVA